MLTRTLHLYRDSFGGLSRDIWLLAMVMLINRSGTMVIPFLTVYLTQQLDFTKPQAGWVMGAFGLGSVAGTYLGGRLTDRYSYYNIQFGSLFLSGLIFILLAYVHTFFLLCMVIFLLSLIADAFRPANFASVAAYSRPENRTRSLSLLRLAVNLGFTAGPALGGLLAALKGYEWLFWVDGLTCIAAAFIFRIFLKYKKEPEEAPDPSGQLPILRSAYQDRTYLIFIFYIFLTAVAFMQLFSTMPVFYKEKMLLDEWQIGLIMGTNGLLVAVLEMPLVFSLEGRYSKLHLVGLGALLIGFSYLSFLLFPSWTGVVWLAVVALTLGEIFNMPFANAYALARSTPRNRGQYMALYSMTYSVAIIAAPVLGLQTAGYFDFGTLWGILGALCLLAFTGIILLKRSEDKDVLAVKA